MLSEYGEILNCQECDKKLRGERGCKSKGIVPFYKESKIVYRCPRSWVTETSWLFLSQYRFYLHNMSPHGKGLLFESDRYLQAMAIIEDENIKIDNEKMKKAK